MERKYEGPHYKDEIGQLILFCGISVQRNQAHLVREVQDRGGPNTMKVYSIDQPPIAISQYERAKDRYYYFSLIGREEDVLQLEKDLKLVR